MKNTLTTILCLLAALALVTAAVCVGARNGWAKEREEALNAFAGSENAASLEERAMDAANLHVVASRHLSQDDPDLAALQSARTVLQSRSASSDEKAQADMALTAIAQTLATRLTDMDSVKQSPRDQVYVATLTRTLIQGRDTVAYAVSIQDFNRRLATSLTGKLAGLLGIKPIDVP